MLIFETAERIKNLNCDLPFVQNKTKHNEKVQRDVRIA